MAYIIADICVLRKYFIPLFTTTLTRKWGFCEFNKKNWVEFRCNSKYFFAPNVNLILFVSLLTLVMITGQLFARALGHVLDMSWITSTLNVHVGYCTFQDIVGEKFQKFIAIVIFFLKSIGCMNYFDLFCFMHTAVTF